MKKTDLMKAIDKFDAEIAKRTKKTPATASKRAAKTSRASASASDNGTAPVSPALFDQQA